jgi:hypothetical protein
LVVPPSTRSTTPVTHEEAGEARYSAAAAISRGDPMRAIGVLRLVLAAQRVVGHHEVHRPGVDATDSDRVDADVGARSAAMFCVNMFSAALPAP